MSKPNKKPQLAKSPIVESLPIACADEKAAREFFEKHRWGDEPYCPHCGAVKVYRMNGKAAQSRGLWRCHECKRQFTVRVGSVMEDSALPMKKWARAIWEMTSSKNGVSALELSRKIQCTHKTALFVLNRLRWAMNDDPANPPKLSGVVEADEVYLGGRYRRGNNADGPSDGRKFSGKATKKTPVAAVLQRGGDVRASVIANVDSKNVRELLLRNVEPSATIMTDKERAYASIGKLFTGGHHSVNHGKHEYVRGIAHVNGCESFFARVQRSLNGTFHAVSKRHLPRYVAQWAWLHNSRKLCDGDRAALLVRQIEGKRLLYRDPIAV